MSRDKGLNAFAKTIDSAQPVLSSQADLRRSLVPSRCLRMSYYSKIRPVLYDASLSLFWEYCSITRL